MPYAMNRESIIFTTFLAVLAILLLITQIRLNIFGEIIDFIATTWNNNAVLGGVVLGIALLATVSLISSFTYIFFLINPQFGINFPIPVLMIPALFLCLLIIFYFLGAGTKSYVVYPLFIF